MKTNLEKLKEEYSPKSYKGNNALGFIRWTCEAILKDIDEFNLWDDDMIKEHIKKGIK